MSFVHEVHRVRGRPEEAFGAAYRDDTDLVRVDVGKPARFSIELRVMCLFLN